MTEYRRVPVSGKRKHEPAQPPDEGTAECSCPRLDPEDWHEVESDWSDIAFLKGTTGAVLGVPTGYDAVRTELRNRAEKIGAEVPEDAMLLLGAGRFRRPVLLEIEGAPEGTSRIERPGGVAYSELVEAPWGKMQGLVDETREHARLRYGREPDAVWIWYLTCRLCSRERNFETLIIAHYRTLP
jgi:hypothetical protein